MRRVLYVEDEPDIRAIGVLSLEAVGKLEVCACASGREALERAPDFAPDLLLLDVMMPEMDGVATLRALRQLPAIASSPAVFLTAKAQPHELRALQQAGAIGVVAKPFDPMTLAEELQAMWKQREEP